MGDEQTKYPTERQEALEYLASLVGDKEEKSLDLTKLFRGIRNKDPAVMPVLYYCLWLRPLCLWEVMSDDFVLSILNKATAVVTFQEFSQLWSKFRPRDTKPISSTDRIAMREVFNSVKRYEKKLEAKKRKKDEEENGQPSSTTDAAMEHSNTIWGTSVFKAIEGHEQIRALASTSLWFTKLVQSKTLIDMVGIIPQRIDFEEYIGVLQSCASIEQHIASSVCSLHPLLLDILLPEQTNLRHEWPIVPYSQVTHRQVECLAELWDVDPKAEPHIIWVVRQALETPLPPDWRVELVPKNYDEEKGNEEDEEKEAKEGKEDLGTEVVMTNTVSGEETTQHPATSYFKKLLSHERQQIDQMLAFGMLDAYFDPTKYWMEFQFPVSAELSEQRQSKQQHSTVSYFYNFATMSARGHPPEPGQGILIKDEAGLLTSKVSRSYQIRQNIDERVFSKENPDRSGEVRTLNFRSWWNDASYSSEQNNTKRYIDIYFHLESGNFQVIIEGTDKIYTFSHIQGRNGPLEGWDLFIGARIRILGRETTLMQASSQTIKWIETHETRLKKVWRQLRQELEKYESGRCSSSPLAKLKIKKHVKRSHGKANLRAYIQDIKSQEQSLSKYRPKIAKQIVGNLLVSLDV